MAVLSEKEESGMTEVKSNETGYAHGQAGDSGLIVVDTNEIPWSSFPGYEEHALFKLLRVDPVTHGSTILLRYKTGEGVNFQGIPDHKHYGAVELLTLSGTWWYEGEPVVRAGGYVYEPAGAVHKAINPDWVDTFIISYGPLQLMNEDGTPGQVVDGMTYYEAAKANNAVAHLPPLG